MAEFAQAILCARSDATPMAAKAWAILDDREEIDLPLSDRIIPDGLTLTPEAKERWPGLKVLLARRYAEASLERSGLGVAGFEILNEPRLRAELIACAALDGPAAMRLP